MLCAQMVTKTNVYTMVAALVGIALLAGKEGILAMKALGLLLLIVSRRTLNKDRSSQTELHA
jgi:hypothetical protein